MRDSPGADGSRDSAGRRDASAVRRRGADGKQENRPRNPDLAGMAPENEHLVQATRPPRRDRANADAIEPLNRLGRTTHKPSCAKLTVRLSGTTQELTPTPPRRTQNTQPRSPTRKLSADTRQRRGRGRGGVDQSVVKCAVTRHLAGKDNQPRRRRKRAQEAEGRRWSGLRPRAKRTCSQTKTGRPLEDCPESGLTVPIPRVSHHPSATCYA